MSRENDPRQAYRRRLIARLGIDEFRRMVRDRKRRSRQRRQGAGR